MLKTGFGNIYNNLTQIKEISRRLRVNLENLSTNKCR